MFPGELRFLVRERHHISIGLRLRCYILLCPLFLFHELLPLNRGFLCKHLSRWTNALPVADCVFSGFTAKESPAQSYITLHCFPSFQLYLLLFFFILAPWGLYAPNISLEPHPVSGCFFREFWQDNIIMTYLCSCSFWETVNCLKVGTMSYFLLYLP